MLNFSGALGRAFLLSVLLVASVRADALAKFQHWYPPYSDDLSGLIQNQCSAQYGIYRSNSTCSPVVDCLIDNTKGSTRRDMIGGSHLLALAPVLLALVGASPPETAVLSVERPILTALIVIASPSTFPVQLFGRMHPKDVMKATTSPLTRALWRFFKDHHQAYTIALCVAQYLLVVAAAFNTIQLSISLGVRTVLIWSCESSFMPLSWNMLNLAIHVFSSANLRLRLEPHSLDRLTNEKKTFVSRVRSYLYKEFVPSIARKTWLQRLRPLVASNVISDLFYWMATTCIAVQLLWGVVVLSSLDFIGISEAALVVLRYACSAYACRMILLLELGGMRTQGLGPSGASLQIVELSGPDHRGRVHTTTKQFVPPPAV